MLATETLIVFMGATGTLRALGLKALQQPLGSGLQADPQRWDENKQRAVALRHHREGGQRIKEQDAVAQEHAGSAKRFRIGDNDDDDQEAYVPRKKPQSGAAIDQLKQCGMRDGVAGFAGERGEAYGADQQDAGDTPQQSVVHRLGITGDVEQKFQD